ncbi:hypoxanthine phosphoribosyltransferase [Agarivorans sp. TSD2052]|uniref:phosphoribosyltransferase n=1 Tax=Agarivorans sp. TSD2052 TaxID=2937286 RepID=UPI00200EB4F1|nr:phosphoribosyltransferase family protein [Agarivorans sp. TSD2052]UPW17075.1 hypoxanthine phosphoribosyltransferase [Agarivorans sp. TSD2052]
MSKQHVGELVLSQAQIAEGVKHVAAQLNQKFQGERVVLITVVPGGILFTADLVRLLNFDICMDYISCPHTPGERNNKAKIVYQQNISISHQHLVIIDDAIESGGTMQRLVTHLSHQASLKSLSIATLLVKPSRVDIPVDQHFAFEMDSDDLLVGYGLPWEQRYRNLAYISKLSR